MPRNKPNTASVSKRRRTDQQPKGDPTSIARTALRAGCALACGNAAVATAGGEFGLDLPIIVCAVVNGWMILTLTLIFVYLVMKQDRPGSGRL
ncbi:hypothetical protein [Actinoplanes aureus]|uniref:Uncharacterized protein n=1 Tax=Actinoplanes aureus TaxID=2792083 RepID=A0A931C422_9ACTN|nr:hypothetical protein [Actinoplanes aureus]MBG0563004.1 hypothetical protein [Actinoplanes aureus]